MNVLESFPTRKHQFGVYRFAVKKKTENFLSNKGLIQKVLLR